MKIQKLLSGIVLSTFLTVAFPTFTEKNIIATDLTGIVYNLKEEEGLKQLIKLSANGSYEDGWYYLPEKEE